MNRYPRDGFLYDTNGISLTVLEALDVTLENPAGSGKKLIIEGYSFINQLNLFMMATLIHMPDTRLPSTVFKPFPYMVGTDISAPGNSGVFKAEKRLITQKMAGGTPVITIPIKGGDRNYVESTPLTLLPGTKIGLSISPGVIVTNLCVSIYTREENLTNA